FPPELPMKPALRNPLLTTVLVRVPPEKTNWLPPFTTVLKASPVAKTCCCPPLKMVAPLAAPPELTSWSPPLRTTELIEIPCRNGKLPKSNSTPPLLIIVPLASPPEKTSSSAADPFEVPLSVLLVAVPLESTWIVPPPSTRSPLAN